MSQLRKLFETAIAESDGGSIVVAWIDLTGRRATGGERHIDKYNRGPEFETAYEAKAIMWANRPRKDDLEKANKWAAQQDYKLTRVYQGLTGNVLEKAKQQIKQEAQKKGIGPWSE